MDRKGYFRYWLHSIINIFNEKNKEILEHYHFKKYLENGKEKK